MSDYERLLGIIYDAPWQPDGWAVVLRELRRAVGATGGHILDSDFSGSAPVRRYLVQQGVPKEAQADYDANWYDRDPRWRYGAPNAGQVVADHEQLPAEVRQRDGLYQEYLPRYDFGPLLSVPFATGAQRIGSVQLLRPNRAELYGAAQKRLLQALLPHLQRAMAATMRVSALLSDQAGLEGALDRLDAALVLLASDGTATFANRQARRIAGIGDGLRLQGKRLLLDDRAARKALDRQIADAANGNAAASPLLVRAKRPSGLPDLLLHIAPAAPTDATASDATAGRLFAAARICLFISDPVLSPLPAADALACAFGLTRAEAKLAESLLNGMNRADYARHAGLSINTVKRQLEHVFAKTQTSSQQELIAVLTRSLAACAANAAANERAE
ncbi:DNA-binding CsgD family transcriptional regulator/PAS domain-containing protein [Azospirillum fermentarium]|uniref:helix-turn-helix transcriptional regulator n=1 Tax=Azospirillum fermentarium TaxID=1233114 RepID=UPI002226C3C4|nr:helix-turn-helix transcriptional regulator [Azospirillum fermentarium]MCW2247844.1 DNA-binding CsgD family transcriptional regulator/PAS domain-containing protein [Azospirillum fermentarium]